MPDAYMLLLGSEFKKSYGELLLARSELIDCHTELKEELQRLQSIWKGTAARQYCSKVLELARTLEDETALLGRLLTRYIRIEEKIIAGEQEIAGLL